MKKIVFALLLLLMVGAVSAADVYVCSNGQKVGDVNGDGLIDMTDAYMIMNITVGNLPTPANICCADVTKDGTISAADAQKVMIGTASGTCTAGATGTTNLSVSPVVIQGNPGTVATATLNLVNTGSIDLSNIVLTQSVLTSGSNAIPITAITLYPSSISTLRAGTSTSVTFTANIPAGQISGTYTGYIAVSYNGNQINTPVTLTVNNMANAPAFTVNDLEFVPVDQQRGQTVSQTLHLVNNGNQQLILNIASNMPSAYQTSFSQSIITLNSGASTDVTVTIKVPLSQNSGRTEITGGITVTATNVAGLTRASRTFVTTTSMLEIYKVSVELNGDEHSIANGDTYNKDIKAGTPVKFTVYVRNNFDSSNDIDISDINVDIRSSGSLDLDESDSLNDLSYGDKDKVTFSATIPSDAEDGDSYSVDVKVSGRDANNALHTDTYNARIQVKRVSHEITISDVSISPQRVTCNGRATINAQLKNTGRYSEDKVHLLITDIDLGVSQRFYEMSLDTDSTLRKTYSFTVDNTTKPGQYDIILTSFYNTDTESDTKVVTLTVDPCPQTSNAYTPNSGNNNNNNQPVIPPQVIPMGGATPVYGSASFTDSTAYVVILVAAVILVLAVLITLLVRFVF